MKQLAGWLKSEKGLALPAVLALLAVGALVAVPTLNYASTTVNVDRMIVGGVEGIYAADAGVEHVMWCILNGLTPPTSLPRRVNGLDVTLQVDNHGGESYTLYMGGFVQTNVHYSFVRVEGDIGPWDADEQAYPYTITLTRQCESTIFVDEIGLRLPEGFAYKTGSANHPDFNDTNICTDEPLIVPDGPDYLVNWGDPVALHVKFENKYETRTQKFYITGPPGLTGDYTWVVAQAQSENVIGEYTGTLSTITSTATRPSDGKVMARIVADSMLITGAVQIISWKVTN